MTDSNQYSDFGRLNGQWAVVTGTSSGIGKAIAEEFAAAGANVILHYHKNQNGAESTAQTVKKYGQQARIVQADLSTEKGLESLVESCLLEEYFPQIWVNNAGVDLLTGSARDWDYETKLARLYETDVRSTMLLSRRVGHSFRARGSGCLINIGWDQAERGMGGDSGELFAAAKNAIMGFTRSLAVSLAPEVRVNCIAPGWILTAWGETASEEWQHRVMDETPLKRWGRPQDIANLARFLASPQASYLTGQVIYANGGAER